MLNDKNTTPNTPAADRHFRSASIVFRRRFNGMSVVFRVTGEHAFYKLDSLRTSIRPKGTRLASVVRFLSERNALVCLRREHLIFRRIWSTRGSHDGDSNRFSRAISLLPNFSQKKKLRFRFKLFILLLYYTELYVYSYWRTLITYWLIKSN